MPENQFINFLGVPNMQLGNSEPTIEWIEYRNNVLRTIKEYREYSDPGADRWLDYILELFHLLGLQTLHIGPRLFRLSNFDNARSEDAIALILNQADDPNEATSGLAWASYLFYVCKFNKIGFGILTDGKSTKLFRWDDIGFHNDYILADLDSMILTDAREDFGLWLITMAQITRKTVALKNISHRRNRTPRLSGDLNKTQDVFAYGIEIQKYQQLFTELQDAMLSLRPDIGNPKKVQPKAYWGFRAGKSGFSFNYAFFKPLTLKVDVYFDTGDYEKNKFYFDELYSSKDDIELELGFPIEWQRLENKRACRIAVGMPFDFNADETERARLYEWAVSTMIKFYDVFRPRILRLPHP